MPNSEKLGNVYVVLIGLVGGLIGGAVPAFHGGLPYLLMDLFGVSFGFISHIVFVIFLNGLLGAILGIVGAWLGINRILKKNATELQQLGIAFVWGLAFGVIPNLFIAGVSW